MSHTTTVVFTDLVASTDTVFRLGDEPATSELTSHLRLLAVEVERHGGRVVKSMGDGIMALFESTGDGLNAAVAMQQAVDRAARRGEGAPRTLRVGINVGDVIDDRDGDVYGASVVIARRLCDRADGGQILASQVVPLLAERRSGTLTLAVGPLHLKGVPDPVEAVSIGWEPLPDEVPVRTVVADDAPLIRTGVVRLLAEEGFDVVAEADDYDSLLVAVARTQPELVITDIRMPPTSTDEGLRAADHIRANHPGVAVLVLSQYLEATAAVGLLDGQPAGVGYLLKERVGDLSQFVDAARRVAGGETVIDPLVTQQLLGARRDRDALARLTEREREVLDLMAQGSSNQAISTDLNLSAKTIETHVRSIFTKLDLPADADGNRRVQAVVLWLDAARHR